MASKGKGRTRTRTKSTLKRDEIRFQDKRIDAKRFAYDVIKYTSLKFGLEEGCIPVRDGSANNYGCDDFCLVVCRDIIKYQITSRYNCLLSFQRRFELNKLESFDLVGRLLQDVMYEELAGPLFAILEKVEISLAVLGELVLYLYTNDIELYLTQLIDHWFDCHLSIKKKSFEAARGLTELYLRNSKPKFDHYDEFNNIFIRNFCLPYKDTANNPRLKEMYDRSYNSRLKKTAESLPPKDPKDVQRALMRGGEVVMRRSERKGYKLAFEIEEEAVPEPPEPDVESESDEDSGVNLPENIGLGIPEHHELYGLGGPLGAAAPPSQNLPEESSEEQLEHGRRLSAREKRQMRMAGFRPGLDQGLGMPEQHELYGVGGRLGVAASPSQNLPEEQPEYGRGLSAREKRQMRMANFRPGLDQDLGIPERHEFHGVGGPLGAVSLPSQDLPEARHEDQPQRSRRQSAKERMLMRRSGLGLSLEDSLGQLSLDSSKPKRS